MYHISGRAGEVVVSIMNRAYHGLCLLFAFDCLLPLASCAKNARASLKYPLLCNAYTQIKHPNNFKATGILAI